MEKELSIDRQKVLQNIETFEKEGRFNEDVEDDIPGRSIKPNEIDYLNKKLKNRIATHFSNKLAIKYFDGEIKKGNLIIKNVVGFENYLAVRDKGVVITCNHCNIYDNYVVFKVLQKDLGRKHLWKVIKEANYTSFPGLFGKLFRHCNTLPLSSNRDTMKLFLTAMDTLLKRGEKVLIYPEQAMWWNYKKPRPFKPGAFRFAVASNAPVLPCFLTMCDSDKLAPDGSYYQEYTLHIFPAIYSDTTLNEKENAKIMADKNFELWKICYETTYNKELTYSCDK